MKKFGKILVAFAATVTAIAAMCSLAACGEKEPAEEGLKLVAPTQTASYWEEKTATELAAEDVSTKTALYQLVGDKNHYDGAQFIGDLVIYSDGYFWQLNYIYAGGNSIPSYHYGYWELDEEEISLTYVAFNMMGSVSDLPGTQSIILQDGKLVGSAMYSIFTYGTDNMAVEGSNKITYSTEEEFKTYADGVWDTKYKPAPDATPAE